MLSMENSTFSFNKTTPQLWTEVPVTTRLQAAVLIYLICLRLASNPFPYLFLHPFKCSPHLTTYIL